MDIIVAVISIFGIAGFVWMLNKTLLWRICPVCAGVSGTWLWMLVATAMGFDIDLLVLALLMGGSVVGIAYQAGQYVKSSRLMLWKIMFIPAGFALSYSILNSQWFAVSILLLVLGGAAIFFVGIPFKPRSSEKKVEELEKKMEDCC